MSFADHLLFVIVVLVHPVAGYLSFRRLLRQVAAGRVVDRLVLYSGTAAGQWLLGAVALTVWAASGRPWSGLGLAPGTGGGFLAAAGLTLAALVLLGWQLREALLADADALASARGRLGNIEILIPRNRRELARFYGLSLTAGVVEELLWRGFVIWYLAQLMPLWSAALISIAGFGLAHAYQGLGNLPRIIPVGALFTILYLLSGTLWLSMLLHAAVDILQGRVGYIVLRRAAEQE